MKAQPCKYCESPVAHNANRCPHCGGKNPYPGFFLQLQRQQQANAADPTNAKEKASVNPAANYVAIGCTGVVAILFIVIIIAHLSSTNQQSSKPSPQPRSRTTLSSPGTPSKF
jgi:RNA polymerase subunit RPABC4/transcription elongation factor Spt4